ncbi:hypothetical protein [Flavobacterium sp. 14A]|uniref:hypothetical protein n=1 Tax=Flavobacterium sp. 14A TaxID=2735896 RepID=UPI0015710296|nr:hypothetical protein [Flavobacterium sp. 14A]NRT13620.1 hypothetical protein [Flavobacterium sp. 14A]
MNIFKRIFGTKSELKTNPKQEITESENTSFLSSTMTQSKLDNLKVGDVISFGEKDKDEIVYESLWIEASENPFKMRIFDCREYALKMISTTQNQEIANKFLELRNIDGSEYIGKFPENGAKCEVDLNFETEGQQLPDGILFKSSKMEEKWDIYKFVNFIFFVRSWTGELVYFCNYIPTKSGFKVDLIVLDDNKIDQEDEFFEFKVVQFLIHSYVLVYPVPHPIPKSLENDKNKILNYSFSMFGNKGLYASYE